MAADVRNSKSNKSKPNSNNTAGNNIHRVVVVVTDPGESNPESKNGDAKLNEGPDYLENLYALVHKCQRGLWKLIESGLKVKD